MVGNRRNIHPEPIHIHPFPLGALVKAFTWFLVFLHPDQVG